MHKQRYKAWLNSKYIDENNKREILKLKNQQDIQERFYKDLEFGTGGLRGIIGAGTNRMNIYTIGKATQGLAEYLLNKYKNQDISVSIAYDSRLMSKEFAETTAATLCANNIKVNLFDSLRPTPILSYTVRYLKSKAGIVITASHNPKQYNGYKVYGEDGGQITDKVAKEIYEYISHIDDFSKIKTMDLERAKESGLLNIIGKEVDKTYIEKVKKLTIKKDLVKDRAKDLTIIYTPIHGSGNIPIRTVLKELGYSNVYVVKEQEKPDGNFPTTTYPNPENKDVFDLALSLAKKVQPDIIFGTDPDCDRIGVVVKDHRGEYKELSGNQTGVLLAHYILSSLKEKNKLPDKGVLIKTIVTTEMAERIAKEFNVELINVLTGFKYIGEKIKEFEIGLDKTYLFGFEESYGYLSGTFVRDKDAVIAATLISEMALYYKTKGMNLYDALISLYDKYGYFKEKLISINLEGKEGQKKILKIIEKLRNSDISNINGVKVVKRLDYKLSIEKNLITSKEDKIHLPKSNVLKFILEDNSWFVVRPSGTEPKMKIYIGVLGNSLTSSEEKINNFKNDVMNIVD